MKYQIYKHHIEGLNTVVFYIVNKENNNILRKPNTASFTQNLQKLIKSLCEPSDFVDLDEKNDLSNIVLYEFDSVEDLKSEHPELFI